MIKQTRDPIGIGGLKMIPSDHPSFSLLVQIAPPRPLPPTISHFTAQRDLILYRAKSDKYLLTRGERVFLRSSISLSPYGLLRTGGEGKSSPINIYRASVFSV